MVCRVCRSSTNVVVCKWCLTVSVYFLHLHVYTWFCTMYNFTNLHFVHFTLMGRTVYTAPSVDQLMHGCLLVQTKKQKTAHSAVRLRPNEHWQTQMVFGLFFRWTFIGLFVCFCLQSCFVFRRQSSKGGSTSGVVKGGLSHHDAWKIFVISRC